MKIPFWQTLFGTRPVKDKVTATIEEAKARHAAAVSRFYTTADEYLKSHDTARDTIRGRTNGKNNSS